LDNFKIEFSKDAFKTYNKLNISLKKRIDRVFIMLLQGEIVDL